MHPPRRASLRSRWICLLLVSGLALATIFACTCSDITLEQDFKDADLVFHGRFEEAQEGISLSDSWERSFPTQPWHDWVALGEGPDWTRLFPGFVRVYQQENRFRVLEVYKGTVGRSVEVSSPSKSWAGSCNFLFFLPGQDYIVFAHNRRGAAFMAYETSACRHTGPLAELSERMSRLGPARPPPFQTPFALALELLIGSALVWLGRFFKKRRVSAPA